MLKLVSKIKLFFLFAFLFVLIPINVQANEEDDIYDYNINDYNIDIIVNENNTFDITETTTVTYNKYNSKITFKIPNNYKVKRENGKTVNKRVKISNIKINYPYSSSGFSTIGSDSYSTYTIKNTSQNINDKKIYQIKYKYNIGKDKVKGKDELYFNINQGRLGEDINHITFSIKMPKNFDQNKIKFKINDQILNNNEITYNVEDNIIKGYLNSPLASFQTLTFSCDLEEGYFNKAENLIDITDYLFFIIPFVCFIIFLIIYYFFTDKKELIKLKKPYIPKDINSLEASYIYNGISEKKDVFSLLIYLANKGYIQIKEKKDSSVLINTNDFVIIKIKEYDGKNIYEKMFLEKIFQPNTNEVTLMSLENSLNKTLNEILKNINNEEYKHKIFDKLASKIIKLKKPLIIITYLIITVIPLLILDPTLIIYIIAFQLLSIYLFKKIFFGKRLVLIKFLLLALPLFFASAAGIFPFLTMIVTDKIYLLGYLLGLIYLIIMKKFSNNLPKRTAYGYKEFLQIQTLKNFIKKSSKEEIKTAINQDPNYLYNSLPFCYVLGLLDLWEEKFKNYQTKNPIWYIGDSNFYINFFKRKI